MESHCLVRKQRSATVQLSEFSIVDRRLSAGAPRSLTERVRVAHDESSIRRTNFQRFAALSTTARHENSSILREMTQLIPRSVKIGREKPLV